MLIIVVVGGIVVVMIVVCVRLCDEDGETEENELLSVVG